MEGVAFFIGSGVIWMVGSHRIANRKTTAEYRKGHDPFRGDMFQNPRTSVNSWTKRSTRELATFSEGTESLMNPRRQAKHNQMKVNAKIYNPHFLLTPFHGAGSNKTPGWHSHMYGSESDAPIVSKWLK